MATFWNNDNIDLNVSVEDLLAEFA